MRFGSDFFKILEFVIAALRMFARLFGDEEDQKADDETREKYGDYGEKLVK
jgi:hypothetical protein